MIRWCAILIPLLLVGAARRSPVPETTRARHEAVDWLKRHQHADGGWSSGRHGSDGLGSKSDVATTAFVVLALQRDEGGQRTHQAAIERGADFVIQAVRRAPVGARLRTPDGTQIQYKLGGLVDTHLAALMLSEVLHRLPEATRPQAAEALQVAVAKVIQAQNADGSFEDDGWAPVLSTALAARGLSRVVAKGHAEVAPVVFARSDAFHRSQVDGQRATLVTRGGAGVQLYGVASMLNGADHTLARTGDVAPAPDARRYAQVARALAIEAVAEDTNGHLLSGFGSLGGEEMLSYMMISETLAASGGPTWEAWRTKLAQRLPQAQNNDGSWVGHHCITSRVFTTAGGVVTLAAVDGVPEAAPPAGDGADVAAPPDGDRPL